MIGFLEADSEAPHDVVYRHYSKEKDKEVIKSPSFEKSTGKDTLQDFDESLLHLKKEKRKVQLRGRMRRKLDEENRIQEELDNEINKADEESRG